MSENCKRARLDEETGIDRLPRSVLDERRIVDDLGWPSVKNGESCDEVIKKYGFMHEEVILTLERKVVEKLAKPDVKKGELCGEVIRKYGLKDEAVIFTLERAAADGVLGKRVRKGESWQAVVKEHEIKDPTAIFTLQNASKIVATKNDESIYSLTSSFDADSDQVAYGSAKFTPQQSRSVTGPESHVSEDWGSRLRRRKRP